jgi:two-component system, OmpR family, phosphate regulon sensor histidine kinase PhoR
MRRRTIATLILLATASMVGVVFTQVIWLDQLLRVKREQQQLQEEQRKQDAKQFNDRVTIALTSVTEQLLSLNQDPSDLYDAVEQERPNYFAVAINDTVHPYLLEALLRKEFKRRNITDDFEYGVYDCFTDSIVYGNYVSLTEVVNADTMKHSTLLELDNDGHYFGVYFPRRQVVAENQADPSAYTWIFPAIVTLIVFGFFVFSVWTILRQKRLSEMKNDFIGNMTHELKTPISTIALSSEVLMAPDIAKDPHRLRAYAGIVRTENERLRTQVERVLQLATLERGSMKLRQERVDLHALIEKAMASFRLTLDERNGTLAMDLRAEKQSLTGDAVHLQNVLHNLLDNAIKYSPSTPRIEIRTWNEGRQLLVSVRDGGIGLGAEEQRRIFQRFYRVSTGNVHDVKGFGLGLHYVQQIVRAHKGTVSVQSALGKGSTFTLTFPQ